MTHVKNMYLANTGYGINLIAETFDDEFYQQVHTTLEMNGGGATVWVKVEKDENNQPILLNPPQR